MGSHRKKKYESDSSDASSDSSSSEEERSNKKASKKHKHSSDSSSESEKEVALKSKKGRYEESSDDSLVEESKQRKATIQTPSGDFKSKKTDHKEVPKIKNTGDKDEHHAHRHKNKSRPQEATMAEDKYKKEYFKERSGNRDRRNLVDNERHTFKDKKDDNSREHRGRDKHDKERYNSRDKHDDKERYNSRDKHDDKDRYDDRDKYEERSRYDNRERHDNRNNDRYRNDDRDTNRRDDNRNFRNNEGYRRDGEDGQRRNDNRRRRSSSFDHASAKWGKPEDDSKLNKGKKTQDKEKPNFGLSGKLTEETNTYRGVVIKYSEPPEARKPRRRWRLYPFKGEKALQTLYIHRESAYLIGRERKIVDLPVDHPSCSKQHAALQYRLVPFTRENGSVGKRVRPYLIDLESANGTLINNKKIEPKKYYELMEKDVLKFGFSSREYVLLHENSKDEALDDDVKIEEEDAEVKVKEEK